MKIFVLGVPHTQTTRAFSTCPFTTKAWNQCRMFQRLGHEVIHLGVAGSDPECTENVAVVTEDEWSALYPPPGAKYYNARSDGIYKPYHEKWAQNVRTAILARCNQPWEAIVCCTWGQTQIRATDGLDQFVVESSIGYRHTWAKYRVFQTYAWMHFHYGLERKFGGDRWYDVVIPNSVDPELFDCRPHAKQSHFLFMGRLNDDKGVALAIDIAKRAGRRITIVGQGKPERFLKGNSHVDYLPPADVEGRRQLMADAAALLCPTRYIEPLGNVALEAQLSGTPVICTDWGGFSETVLHGVTGYRCRTMEQFLWAANHLSEIDPQVCRQWITTNFSPTRVAQMYDEYFQMLADLSGQGWYAARPNRGNLDWLRRSYPASS